MAPGKIYHIYNRGTNRQKIFFEESNYVFFLKQLDKYLTSKIDVLSYCLMPNHFHLLIRIKVFDGQTDDESTRSLIKSFRDFLISYSKAINKRFNRTGALFQQKFKRREVDTDAYLSAVIQYIHMNPVKAGLCTSPEGWKYSSFNAIVNGKPTKICVNEVLEWFGGKTEFVRIHLHKVLEDELCKQLEMDD